MLCGHGHVGHAHQRVRTGGKYPQRLGFAFDLERQLYALGPADPVALHGLDRLGPAIQLVKILEQFVRIGSDLHEPLRYLAPLDQRVRAPAAAVDDLLVGQYGLVDRIPVDDRILAVDEAFLEHLGKQPLLPAVVLGLAGRHLAAPVIAVAQAIELAAHIRDVLIGPLRRRDAAFDRGIFGGHAEGVPAHRLHDMPALHALVAGDHVRDRVDPDVPHVQVPAGVREHGQAVEFLFTRLLIDVEAALLFPERLRLTLDLLGFVRLVHPRYCRFR